jgi:polyribonucleotide nucleotidyltransferase
MLGAVVFGHEQMQPVIDLINELATKLESRCGIGHLHRRTKS